MDECDMDIRFCRQLQCQNTVGTYTCGCRQGFEKVVAANNREYTCADIDECTNRYICPKNAVCRNLEGGYECTCNSGFERETCSDIDECITNTTICDADADCNNSPGSFQCECRKGFFGSGQKCEKGQCQDSVCPDNKICASLTTFDCICKGGFKNGVNDTCDDINECSIINICDVNAKCINSPGSYLCECAVGFYGNGETCREGDCIESDCPANEQCVSPRRSDCECKTGFHRDVSGQCIDTNECEQENNCHQNSTCSNTEGSYNCDCKTDFFGTGYECLEGECTDATCPGNQTCIAKTSSCHCSKGLKNDGEYCYDVDECSLGSHSCPKRSNCINQLGDYSCDCFAGYNDINCTNMDIMICQTLDGVSECFCKDGFDEHVNGTCTDIDECTRDLHGCKSNLECINNFGDYACKSFCGEGFNRADNGICSDIDECISNFHNCSVEQSCLNTNGSFSCTE